MKQFPLLKSCFFVAKVVKTFSCIAQTTENLVEFRYRQLHSVAETGRGGEKQIVFARIRWAFRLCVLYMAFILMSHTASAQVVERNVEGLYELKSTRLTLITDVPIDDELKSWPGLVEQSLKQWQLYFDVSEERMTGLKVQATLIGDRPGLTKLGVLDGVPGFDEGYQYGNRIYLREQPTVYFRRHLFLHELTHWIVWELYGGGGSPWFMEGMAEMQATHLMSGGRLMLCMIPSAKEQVSGWGRLRIVRETLERGEAPSLTQIFAYGDDREDHLIRYSWSWAACVFFTSHPKYGPVLRDLYRQKLDYSQALSQSFKEQLSSDWENVQVDWNAFVSDLDFGYDIARSAVNRSSVAAAKALRPGESIRLELASDRGWQATGVLLDGDTSVRVKCSGSFQIMRPVQSEPTSWQVEPNGITFQYYRGNPLGSVVASVVSSNEPEQTKRWETQRVGLETTLTSVKKGELFLKVNEPSKGLSDNEGTFSIEISVTKL
jgi:hypothetical protein